MLGETLLYEEKIKILPGVDIGPVPEGRRVNFPFTGEVNGPRIHGKIDGVDYVLVRPDGVSILHPCGVITVDGGDLISIDVSAFATATPDGRIAIKGALTFQTASKEFAWLNSTQGVEEGFADMRTRELEVKVFTI